MGDVWLSMCSAHREYDANCPRCQAGDWFDEAELAADHDLYQSDYAAWYAKHNSGKTPE